MKTEKQINEASGWIEIDENEFKLLLVNSVKSHELRMCTPSIHLYWNKEGSMHSDLSWGKHAFLKEIKAANHGEPYVWEAQYWKKV